MRAPVLSFASSAVQEPITIRTLRARHASTQAAACSPALVVCPEAQAQGVRLALGVGHRQAHPRLLLQPGKVRFGVALQQARKPGGGCTWVRPEGGWVQGLSRVTPTLRHMQLRSAVIKRKPRCRNCAAKDDRRTVPATCLGDDQPARAADVAAGQHLQEQGQARAEATPTRAVRAGLRGLARHASGLLNGRRASKASDAERVVVDEPFRTGCCLPAP